MQKILVATTNPGKLEEIRNFLSDLPLEIVSLRDIGITDDVEEKVDVLNHKTEKIEKWVLKAAEKTEIPYDA